MDFIDQLKAIGARIPEQTEYINTEEATKTSMVMPLIQALGYNVFDPREVSPELVADVGVKKGEKVDYAILRDGKPIMLFECKHWKTNLNTEHASQLFRYFTTTAAKVAVLTNGIEYRFFTDLEEPNKMDSKPFLILNMRDIQEPVAQEVKKLSKDHFDGNAIADFASELKYTREIKNLLAQQMSNPDDEFSGMLIRHISSERITQKVLEKYKPVIAKALRLFISDTINERLKTAFEISPEAKTESIETPAQNSTQEQDTEATQTTFDEIEGFYIVKAILREVIDPRRIAARDVQSYFGVLLDDNNRKPICRLYLNGAKWYIGLFDKDRKEERIAIEDLQDIYQHADRLAMTIMMYQKID